VVICIDKLYIQKYINNVKFERDDEKNRINIEKHSVDFNDAIDIFQNIRLTVVDKRRDYGETRKISIGKINNNICIVVYTERKDVIRIISARKANQRERRKYYEHIERAKTEKD